MSDVKTSSFKLPNGEVIETVFVRKPDGSIAVRRPEELIPRPAPPAPKG